MMKVNNYLKELFNEMEISDNGVEIFKTLSNDKKGFKEFANKYSRFCGYTLALLGNSNDPEQQALAVEIISTKEVFKIIAPFLDGVGMHTRGYPLIFETQSKEVLLALSENLPFKDSNLAFSHRVVSLLPEAYRGSKHIVNTLANQITSSFKDHCQGWSGENMTEILNYLAPDTVYKVFKKAGGPETAVSLFYNVIDGKKIWYGNKDRNSEKTTDIFLQVVRKMSLSNQLELLQPESVRLQNKLIYQHYEKILEKKNSYEFPLNQFIQAPN